MTPDRPLSTLPRDRNPRLWNAMLDGICEQYEGLEDNDEFLGVFVKIRSGSGQAFLIIRTGGEVRRIPVSGDGMREAGAA